MPKLTVLDHLPDGLLQCGAHELADVLDGPTLIHLPGVDDQPLFVSVLLHGNEHTGFDAARRVLAAHDGARLPRAVSLFIGNVAAARAGVRALPDQPDYNRVWPGTEDGTSADAAILSDVTGIMAARAPFASIDIHNNTGRAPHYACLNRLDDRFIHLARMFSRTVVFFERPLGVQSAAFARLCPAITLECGKSGAVEGTDHAAEVLEACLNLDRLPDDPVAPGEVELMRTFATVKVPGGVTFSFDGAPADIRFRTDIDRLNFTEVAPGTPFGERAPGSAARLEVTSAGDVRIDARELQACFDYEGGEIRFAREVIPCMLTRESEAVRADCLCYLMYRIGLDGRPLAGPGRIG